MRRYCTIYPSKIAIFWRFLEFLEQLFNVDNRSNCTFFIDFFLQKLTYFFDFFLRKLLTHLLKGCILEKTIIYIRVHARQFTAKINNKIQQENTT